MGYSCCVSDTVGIVPRAASPAPRASLPRPFPHDQSVHVDQCAQPDGRRGADNVPGAPAHGHHQPARQRAAGRRLPGRSAARGRIRAGAARERAGAGESCLPAVRVRFGGAALPGRPSGRGRGGGEGVEASAVRRRDRRGLPVGARRHRHEEHGRHVHGGDAPAGARERGAVARRHLRRGGGRGGRLPDGLALAGREPPGPGDRRVRDRRVGRLLAARGQDHLLPGAGGGEGHLLGACARARRAGPRVDAARRQRGAGAVGAAGPAARGSLSPPRQPLRAGLPRPHRGTAAAAGAAAGAPAQPPAPAAVGAAPDSGCQHGARPDGAPFQHRVPHRAAGRKQDQRHPGSRRGGDRRAHPARPDRGGLPARAPGHPRARMWSWRSSCRRRRW